MIKDTLAPTLMQTVEGTPVLVHAGPFANIAHGNSSVIADELGLGLVGPQGYVVTEAGFGADIGLEKFMNIKCRASGRRPDAVVLVATVRALKVHGGGPTVTAGTPLPSAYREEDLDLVRKGVGNLARHVRNAKAFGQPVVVAINRFASDTDAELEAVRVGAREAGADAAVICTHHAEGGRGAVALGQALLRVCEGRGEEEAEEEEIEEIEEEEEKKEEKKEKAKVGVTTGTTTTTTERETATTKTKHMSSSSLLAPSPSSRRSLPPLAYTYDLTDSIRTKVRKIARDVYGAGAVTFSEEAEAQIAELERLGLDQLPVCMAKTQYSFTADAKVKGAPEGFVLPVRAVRYYAGAGFVVPLVGTMMMMPGLPTRPCFFDMDVDQATGKVLGLS